MTDTIQIKKKTLKLGAVGISCIALLIVSVLAINNYMTERETETTILISKISQLQTYLAGNLSEIARLNDIIAQLNANIQHKNAEIEQLSNQTKDLTSQLAEANSQIERDHAQIEYLTRRIEVLEASPGPTVVP